MAEIPSGGTPLAVVGTPSVLQRLGEQTILPFENLRDLDFRAEGILEKPVLWIEESRLRRPEPTAVGDSGNLAYRAALQEWEKLIHLAYARCYIQVVVLEGPSAWNNFHEYFQRVIKPEIQSHVRNKQLAPVLVLVFEWDLPSEGVLDKILEISKFFSVYLMEPKLNVSSRRYELVHSRHIWPLAVDRLLLSILSGKKTFGGIFAWRSLRLESRKERQAAQEGIARDWKDFRNWFLRCDEDFSVGLGAAAVPQGVFDGSAERKRLAAGFSLTSPAPEIRLDLDFVGIKVSDSGLRERFDLGQRLERWEGRLSGGDYGTASRQAAEKGDAVTSIESHTDPQLASEQAMKWAEDVRRGKVKNLISQVIDSRQKMVDCFNKVHETPPQGGPGIYRRLRMQGETLIERMKIGAVFEAQAEALWKLSRQASDLSRAREALCDEARELQRARDHLLNDGSRVILGIACAVLVGFVVAQGVAAWSGIWISGGSLFRVPLQQFQVILVWAAFGLLGVACGILLPRSLELRRGEIAARRVQSKAEDLRRAMFSLVEARARFCGVTGEVGRAGYSAADYRRAAEIGGHDDRVVTKSCPDEVVVTTASLPELEVPNEPAASASTNGAWDVKVFEESSRADIEIELIGKDRGEIASAAGAGNVDVYRVWREGFESDVHARAGWLSSVKVRAISRKIFQSLCARSHKRRLVEIGTFDLASKSSSISLEAAFARWIDGSGALTPMLSASFEKEAKLESFIAVRVGPDSEMKKKNIETLVAYCQGNSLNSVEIAETSKFDLPECIPGFIVAEVFQEVRLSDHIESKLRTPETPAPTEVEEARP
jgi:hypothetical protein